MPLVNTEYSCPACKNIGKKSQIVANAGELQCTTDGMHKWVDTAEFLALRPTMDFATEKPRAQPLQSASGVHHVPIKVMLPPGLKEKLDAKYGDKTDATLSSILMQMLEGDILIIGQTDLDRIGAKMGKTFRR